MYLSSIHSSPALPQAYLVSYGALLLFPPFTTASTVLRGTVSVHIVAKLLCTTRCLLHVLLQLCTAVLCTMLCCFPLLSITCLTLTMVTTSKGVIPLVCCFQLRPPPCMTQSFPSVCLAPNFSPTAADVEQLTVGAMQCSEWCILWL